MSQTQGSLGVLSPALDRLPHLPRRLWFAAIAVAAVAALFPGLWTFIALAGLSICLLLVIRPEIAVYLLALSVPLGSLLEVEWGQLSATPTEGLAGLLALGWIARSLARRRFPIPLTPLTVPLAVMLSLVALSGFQATEPALTLKEALKWLELALVYFFIVVEMRGPRQVSALLLMVLAGAAIEALLGFVQFGLGLGPETFAIGPFMRAYGTFEQPNPFAGYLGMLIPLAAGFLLTRPSRNRTVYVLLVSLLAILAVLMSLSRGAWVGIALGLSAMMLFWSRRSLLALGAGLLAAVPVAALAFLNLLPSEITSRLATALDYFRFVDVREEVVTPQNWAVVERMAHWQAALEMIASHPLTGVGAGNYPAAYELYSLPGWDEALGHAHNYYLNVAAEMGIPALVVYLWLLTAALVYTVKGLIRSGMWSDPTPPPPSLQRGAELDSAPPIFWRGILLGVLGALVASSIHNEFDSLFVHSMSVQLGMILALGQLSVEALSREKAVSTSADRSRGGIDLPHSTQGELRRWKAPAQ